MAMTGQVARVGQPVLRLAFRVQDAIERHLLGSNRDGQPRTHEREKPEDRSGPHGRSPFSVIRYATTSSISAGVSWSRDDGIGESFTKEKSRRSDRESETSRPLVSRRW